MMALDLPVIGQELLQLNYSEGEPKISGNFGTRLKKSIKSQDDFIFLREFFSQLGELLRFLSEKDRGVLKGWKLERDKTSLLVTKEFARDAKFSMKAFQYSDHFERVTMDVTRTSGESGDLQETIKLELFVTECTL